MQVAVVSNDRVPFGAARSLLAAPVLRATLSPQMGLYLRPVTHATPDIEISLSDSQAPGEQLRFYSPERVRRGWRFIGHHLADTFDALDVVVSGSLSEADMDFFATLRTGGLKLNAITNGEMPAAANDPESVTFADFARKVTQGDASDVELGAELDRLLSCADSWSALALARAAETRGAISNPKAATSAALAYSLQGCNDDAERLFTTWESAGGLETARARYSLAMLYARHHDASRRNAERAASYLQSAFDILAELPDSAPVRYERVFNRNGYALLLFRAGQFDEAASLLEDGIAELSGSRWGGQLHHTVLLNNLGRVYAALGQWQQAESALTRAVALDPLFAEYRQDLASFLCDQDRYEEAHAEVGRARELDPAVPEILELHAYTCARLGQPEQAVDGYEQAWQLGSITAGLSLLRTLSELEEYERIAELSATMIAAQLTPDDRAEAELIGLEARSMLDPQVDVHANLLLLAEQYPDSELIAENLKLVGAAQWR